MNGTLLLERLPLWGIFGLTALIVLLSVKGGFVVGAIKRRRTPRETEGPIGSVVGATLGLLAFVLAFTFGMTASRFDTRKQLLLDEVNALDRAVLRADLLPEPYRTESRKLLKRYVELRATLQPSNTAGAMKESEDIQDQLWSHAMVLARTDLDSDIGALFVASLNEVIDLHTSRATFALQYRIPASILLVLLVATIFSMAAVGYQFGLSGHHNFFVHLAMAVVFSAVITLIIDLDRPTSGSMQVSQQPMIELNLKLNRSIR